jgi:hypothetical protein
MDQQAINKITRIYDSAKKKKIESYQQGLLTDLFDDIKGNPEEVYNRLSQLLTKVVSYLRHIELYIKDETFDKSKITKFLDEYDKFTDTCDILPASGPSIDDYKKHGRMIKLKRMDTREKFGCTDETYNRTMDRIEHEQYQKASNKVRQILSKGTALIPPKYLTWQQNTSFQIHSPIGTITLNAEEENI